MLAAAWVAVVVVVVVKSPGACPSARGLDGVLGLLCEHPMVYLYGVVAERRLKEVNFARPGKEREAPGSRRGRECYETQRPGSDPTTVVATATTTTCVCLTCEEGVVARVSGEKGSH